MNELFERVKEKRRMLTGLTIGFILLTIPVIFLVDDFVHDVILVPIAYYVWIGNIIINALPQSCFLTILIILSFVIIIPSLRRDRRKIWRPTHGPEIVDGEVTIWEQRLRLLTRGAYTENRFAYHLGHLVLQILAYEERLPIRAVIYNIENGAFDMPDHVRQYVLNGIGMGSMQKGLTLGQRIRHWCERILRQHRDTLTTQQCEDIIPTIQYIESMLQIDEVEQHLQPNVHETSLSEVSYVE